MIWFLELVGIVAAAWTLATLIIVGLLFLLSVVYDRMSHGRVYVSGRYWDTH